MKINNYDILFIDFMIEKEHRLDCNSLVESINHFSSTLSVSQKNYISVTNSDNHKSIEIDCENIPGKNFFDNHRIILKNITKQLKVIRNYNFKLVIILGYEPIELLLFYKKIRKIAPIVLFQHHQLDEIIKSTIKTIVFNKIKTKVHHIIHDESMISAVSKSFNIPEDLLFPYTAPVIRNYDTLINKTLTNSILCISNSNDDCQVIKIIEREKKLHEFEKAGYKLIIRMVHDDLSFEDTSSIKFIHGFITEQKYNELYSQSSFVLMPFRSEYNFAVSGTLIDALCLRKRVLISHINPEIEYYTKKYPSLCKVYKDENDIFKVLSSFSIEINDNEYEMFMASHSLQYRLICAEAIIKGEKK